MNTSHGIGSHQHSATPVKILGHSISFYSREIIEQLAASAHLHVVHITSVHRTVHDQARIFFQKHVVDREAANYKNPAVSKIVAHARELKSKGSSDPTVQAYLVKAIMNVHGGPITISRHLGQSPLIEVFDVGHYHGRTHGPGRHNYMNDVQARAFLHAARDLIPCPIARLGHSSELGFKVPTREFADEKCFHFEIIQPVFDRLESASDTRIA
jgi:hypothetical protein